MCTLLHSLPYFSTRRHKKYCNYCAPHSEIKYRKWAKIKKKKSKKFLFLPFAFSKQHVSAPSNERGSIFIFEKKKIIIIVGKLGLRVALVGGFCRQGGRKLAGSKIIFITSA